MATASFCFIHSHLCLLVCLQFSLVLIRHLEGQLLECNGFEQLLDTMKKGLPKLAERAPEVIVQEAMRLDIHDKLTTFEVCGRRQFFSVV